MSRKLTNGLLARPETMNPEKIPASMNLLESGFKGDVSAKTKLTECEKIGVRISDQTYDDIMKLVEWKKKDFNTFARSAFSAVLAVEKGMAHSDAFTHEEREAALRGEKPILLFDDKQKFTEAPRAQNRAGQARMIRLTNTMKRAIDAYCKKYDLTTSQFGRLALEQAVVYVKEKSK